MKIARCTPSRGLVHSRTEETAEQARVWAAQHGYEWRNFWTHDLPIPDCFNNSVGQAYDWGADVVWILEEDVALADPGAAFESMMHAIAFGADVAVIDYVMDWATAGTITWGVVRDGAGNIAWTRTGCILFKRECLDVLPRPWFTLYGRLFSADGTLAWQGGAESGYGADVGFTHCLGQLGFAFREVEAECEHLRVFLRGRSGTNDGTHTIKALPTVPKRPNVPPRRHSTRRTNYVSSIR